MSALPAMSNPTPGELASNGITIVCLSRAVRSGESAFTMTPPLIAETLEGGKWRHWTDAGGSYRYPEDGFQDFVEAEPPHGLGVTLEVLEALLKPDSRAWVLFHETSRRKPGGNHNNVMVDGDPVTIPIRGRESQEGNSVSYGIRVLGEGTRARPPRPDLLDRVKAGDLSVHAAMVQAGFREPSLTIPADPVKAARRLLKHFQGDSLATLISELSRGEGHG